MAITMLDTTEFSALICRSMSEDTWSRFVSDYAGLQGWLRAHFRPARTENGWRTAVSGDGKGFPDWVFIRRGRLVVVELKRERGSLTPEQKLWLEHWRSVPSAETYVWRPSDRDEVLEVLA